MGLGSGAGCGRNVAAVITGYGENWKGGSSSGGEAERGILFLMLLQAVYFESLSCQLFELMRLRSGTGCDRFVDLSFQIMVRVLEERESSSSRRGGDREAKLLLMLR